MICWLVTHKGSLQNKPQLQQPMQQQPMQEQLQHLLQELYKAASVAVLAAWSGSHMQKRWGATTAKHYFAAVTLLLRLLHSCNSMIRIAYVLITSCIMTKSLQVDSRSQLLPCVSATFGVSCAPRFAHGFVELASCVSETYVLSSSTAPCLLICPAAR